MTKTTTRKAASDTEAMVLAYATSRPQLGQFRVSDALCRRGVKISPSAVRAIWKRHELETLYKRVSAIEKRGPHARSGMTEEQRALFKRAVHRHLLLKDVEIVSHGGKSKIRRRQLLVAAAQAFYRHGYKGATLKRIAEAGGILPGSIYHYFRSKEDLYVQVHDEGFKDLNAAVTRALVGVREPRARLEAACAAHLALLVGGDALAGFTGNTLVFTPNMDMLNKRLIKVRNAYETRIRTLISALDLPARIDRTQFRLALLGALNWTPVWYRQGKKSTSQIARDLVEIFCR